jgi:hypothetical protein
VALDMFDGFDDRDAVVSDGKWHSSSHSIVTTGPRTGTRHLSGGSGSYSTRTLLVGHATVIIGFALNYSGGTVAGGSDLLKFFDPNGSTVHVSILPRGDGGFNVYRGDGSVLLGSSPAGLFTIGQYDYWEFKVTRHDTTGAVEIRKNAVTVYSLTNQDTNNGGTGTVIAYVQILGAQLGGAQTRIDDVYIVTGDATAPNDYLGDSRCTYCPANADGVTVQWDLSTGTNHYEVVDEVPPSTSDFAYTNVEDEIELLNVADISTTVRVHAVQSNLYMLKSDSGSRKARRVLRSGSTNFFGSDVGLGVSANHFREIFVTDPNTSAEWTPTNVNAVQIGAQCRDAL